MAEKAQLKRFTGSVGIGIHEWQGEDVVLRWRTDHSVIKYSMTAYVEF